MDYDYYKDGSVDMISKFSNGHLEWTKKYKDSKQIGFTEYIKSDMYTIKYKHNGLFGIGYSTNIPSDLSNDKIYNENAQLITISNVIEIGHIDIHLHPTTGNLKYIELMCKGTISPEYDENGEVIKNATFISHDKEQQKLIENVCENIYSHYSN